LRQACSAKRSCTSESIQPGEILSALRSVETGMSAGRPRSGGGPPPHERKRASNQRRGRRGRYAALSLSLSLPSTVIHHVRVHAEPTKSFPAFLLSLFVLFVACRWPWFHFPKAVQSPAVKRGFTSEGAFIAASVPFERCTTHGIYRRRTSLE
jgi:hypothetical protein